MAAVFISYSRADKDFVHRLHDALATRGYDVWVDYEDIPPSSEWLQEITDGITGADDFVFVLSPDSARSEVCAKELAQAVTLHKHIVPVLHREPGAVTLPEAAASHNWVFLRDEDDFQTGTAALFAAVETDFEHKAMHTRLGVAAERWETSNRPGSQLLRGADLLQAEAWLVGAGAKEPAPTQHQREYVLASRQANTRRQRVAIGGVTVAMGVAVALAIVALIQRAAAIHERDVAFARQLDAQAQSQSARDPELSLLLAEKAAQVAPGPTTEQALRAALAQSQVRRTFRLGQHAAGDATWSPDGRRLLLTSPRSFAEIVAPGTAPVKLPPPSSAGESGWDGRGDRVVIGGAHPAVYLAATGKLLTRLPGVAVEAALSADGRRVATTDFGAVGHVYAVGSRRQLASFHPAYHAGVNCLAWAPDDSEVAQCDVRTLTSAQTPAELDTWDPRSGRLLHSIHAPAFIASAAFSPDGKRCVYTTSTPLRGRGDAAMNSSVAAAGTIVIDARSGRRIIAFPQSGAAASFSPGGTRLAYATVGDGLGHVYDFDTHLSHVLTGQPSGITSMAFNRDSTDVATAGLDGTARVYDASTGSLLETLAGDSAAIRSIGFGMNGTELATSSDDGTTRLWAGPDPGPSTMRAPHGSVESVRFGAGGSTIVEADASGAGQVLRASDLRPTAMFQAPPGEHLSGAASSSDDRVIAALAGPAHNGSVEAERAITFDGHTGRMLADIAPPGAQVAPLQGALDLQGDRLLTVTSVGRADVWEPRSGRHLFTLPGGGRSGAVGFNRNGSELAILRLPLLPTRRVRAATDTFGGVSVELWDARGGRHLRTINGPALTSQIPGNETFAIPTLAFSFDGRVLALGGVAAEVELFRTADGSLIKNLDTGGAFVDSLAFSPDASKLAGGTGANALVWRLPGGGQLPSFPHADPATNALILPGSGVLVDWSADSRILSTSGDFALEAWHVADHFQVFKTFAVQGALRPDASELVSSSGAGLAVYPCGLCGNLADLLKLAPHRLTRGFTAEERATYLRSAG